MTAFTKLDIFEQTSLTRNVLHRGRDRAVRQIFDRNDQDGRTLLNEAIDNAISEMGAETHPDDSTLPLASITARAFASGKVMLMAEYQRPEQQVDLSREAKAQTTRRVGTTSVEWWRDTTAFDADGLPNGPITLDPVDNAGTLQPRSFAHTVGIQTIEMPTILSDHPPSTFLELVGTVNSSSTSQFLTTGSFPASTLYFNGWTSSYIGNDQFLVIYRVTHMRQKWPRMVVEWDDTNEEWTTTIESAYESQSWGTLPVHSTIS